MDKYIPIEYQYGRIILDFEGMKLRDPEPVPQKRWDELHHAERIFYKGEAGIHGWTDVNDPETNPEVINFIWEHCEQCLEMTRDHWCDLNEVSKNIIIARQVACTLAVMTFGPSILLKA